MVCLSRVVQSEYNRFEYIPLGVGIIISPWNFAFAIMAGTTVAAMVAGNTVLLKPAAQHLLLRLNLSKCLKKQDFQQGL